MKTQISQAKAVTLSLLILALVAVPGRAQGTYTASYLGGGIWEQDGNWSTTAYPNNGHFVLIGGNPFPDGNPFYNVAINIAAPCTLGASVTVQGVSIANGSTLNLANNAAVTANAPFVCNGLVTLNSTGGFSFIRAANGSGLGGTGQILMSNNATNVIDATNTGGTFTIAPGGIIQGTGTISPGPSGGSNMAKITNQGLIQASNANSYLNIRVENFTNTPLTNTGTLRASNGATLLFYSTNGGMVLNSGGTVEALADSTFRLGRPVTLEGGTITTSGTGVVRGGGVNGNGGGTLSNVTNTGTVAIADNHETLTLAGTFTNNGSVTLNSSDGNGATLLFADGTTLAGPGAVTLSNLGNGLNYIDPTTRDAALTVASGATIQGTGSIGSQVAKITNQGLIHANNANSYLNIRLEDLNIAPLTNTGTLRASNGATLLFYSTNGGMVLNSGGTVEALADSTFRLGRPVTLEGGTITTSGTGVVRGGGVNGNGGGTLSNVTNTGAVAIADDHETLTLAGTFTNNGSVTLNSPGVNGATLLFADGTTLAGTGAVTLSNLGNGPNYIDPTTRDAALTVASGATIQGTGSIGSQVAKITNQGLIHANNANSTLYIRVEDLNIAPLTNTGTLRASNGATLTLHSTNGGMVTNNGGTLHVLPTSTISGSGPISLIQTAGTIDLDGGNMNFPLGIDLNGGQLIGNGTFTGPIRNNGGIVGPGHSPGKIMVTGDYTQGATGTLNIEIGGAAAGTGYDQLQVSGTAALGGTLNLSLINGFLPSVGDVFSFILPSAFTGAFSTINTTGFTGQVNYSASAITITVLSVGGGTPTPTPTPPPGATPSKLLNVATRMRVQTGENVLIGGFIINGTDSKNVIIRGIGPSLSSFFSGVLANPTLELFQGNTLLQSNNDWKDTQRTEIEATGLQPSNDSESAIVRTLPPGSYTAIVRGFGDTTGIGVVEAYDLNQTANSKFANIATRGFVEAGDNVMIGGLIIGPAAGSTAKVVVRAIGPSLTAFGIAGALQDPTVDLKDANGTTLISNDNWQQGQPTEIQQLGLAPGDTRESALVTTLSPGAYTAIVRGVGNTTGVGLVEVYNVQ